MALIPARVAIAGLIGGTLFLMLRLNGLGSWLNGLRFRLRLRLGRGFGLGRMI